MFVILVEGEYSTLIAQDQEGPTSGINYGRSERFTDGVLFFAFGAMFAVVALLLNMAIDGMAIALTQRILNRNVCLDGFGDTTIVAMLGVAIVTSLLVGAWLYHFRFAVGASTEPESNERSKLIRRRFTWGSTGLFILATPPMWLFMLGMAYCNAGAGA